MEECPMKEFQEMTERAFGLLSYLTSSIIRHFCPRTEII
jgi:hypothetical protein